MAGQGWKGLRALVKIHVTIPRQHSPLHMDDTLPRDMKKNYIHKRQMGEQFIDRKIFFAQQYEITGCYNSL